MIKPADYANKLGISRQAVYAKIKKGILSSKSVDGKLYIVLEDNMHVDVSANKNNNTSEKTKRVDQSKLLDAKDETISVLKETVKDLKETNLMITSTLRGEVDLLKEAFGEMKMFYSLQLENKPKLERVIENSVVEDKDVEIWLEVSNFYKEYSVKKKNRKGVLKRLKKMYKKSDYRVDMHDGEIVYLANADFSDLLKKV